MSSSSLTASKRGNLLTQIIEQPNLLEHVRRLEPSTFATLVRRIGLEDAGEIVALATSEQLITAFDEDLFVNSKPGERERFDVGRFVTWLEVMLEAGDEVVANRVSELGEDFVAHAVGALAVVLDYDALRECMSEGGEEAEAVDKHLDACFSEELDGYLIVARTSDGWDALWTLLVALDGNQRDFLVRVLDLAVHAGSGYLENLEELGETLSAAESLAEDVRAAREERRAKLGYVDPEQAKAFLRLARDPSNSRSPNRRDPITRAYFREIEKEATRKAPHRAAPNMGWFDALQALAPTAPQLPGSGTSRPGVEESPLQQALQLLAASDPATHAERVEELAYLVNVLMAGSANRGERFSPSGAREAVLATVALGMELRRGNRRVRARRAQVAEACELLRHDSADGLFRMAAGALSGRSRGHPLGFLRSLQELPGALDELRQEPRATRLAP